MWNESDKQGFEEANSQQLGQFSKNTDCWNLMKELAQDLNNETFLEVGTWNGYGSTMAIVEGLRTRSNPNYIFYSLECNKEKHQAASQLYKDDKNVHILNEVLTKLPLEIIAKKFPFIKKEDGKFHEWAELDYQNCESCELFWGKRLASKKIFDVVILDGGEYTTWFEFLLLKNKTNIFVLDDTRSVKNKDAYADLLEDSEWIHTARMFDNDTTDVFMRKNRLSLS